MGSQGREDVWQGGSWRTRWVRQQLQQLTDLTVPHSPVDKLGETTGE